MDNTALQRFREEIQRSQQVGILVGKNPTIDTMGAGLSLYLALQQMGKSVSIASPTDPIVELTSLVGIDQVKSTVDASGGDLVVSFPYKEGEIEKVSYTVEGGYLNIVVKASEEGLSFTEQDVKYSHGGGEVELLIVVGAQSLEDLGSAYNPEAMKNAIIVNIDTNPDNSGFGDIVMTTQAASVSEEVANLLMGLGFEPDVDIAQNLLTGITYGTGNFQNPNTSFMAFEMAAYLMRKGAVRVAQPMAQPQFQDAADAMPMPRPQQPSQPQQQQPRRDQGRQQFQGRQGGHNRDNRDRGQRPQQQQQAQQPQQNREQGQQQAAPRQQEQTPGERPPADWLTPKVYKGSTNI